MTDPTDKPPLEETPDPAAPPSSPEPQPETEPSVVEDPPAPGDADAVAREVAADARAGGATSPGGEPASEGGRRPAGLVEVAITGALDELVKVGVVHFPELHASLQRAHAQAVAHRV